MGKHLKLAIGLALATAIVAAGLVWYWRDQAKRAELQAGVDATRVIEMRFENTVQLGVRHLSGRMVTTTQATGCYGWCTSTQATRAPFSIDYTLDLKGLPSSAYRWNGRDRVMFVELPDVKITPPNVDMAAAEVEQGGVWISRTMGREMQQRAARNIGTKTVLTAREPENMNRARDSARAAVTELIRSPLNAAGLGNIRIEVRLAGDPQMRGNSVWDMSRTIPEVLADPLFRDR